MHKLITALLIMLSLVACDVSKKYVKQADALVLAGDQDGAANLYYNALLAKPNKPEAMNGLNKTGNVILQNKFANFSKYVVAKNDEQAVKQYISCRKYYNKCQSVGVVLDWPTLYDPIYEDLKNDYISRKYNEGVGFMKANNYGAAEKSFAEIAEIDSTYKDATVLRVKSIIEPIYQHGITMMKIENYKESYRDFSKVVSLDPAYKNVKALREESLAKASVGLGVLPVQNQTRVQGFDVRLYQQIIATLVQSKNPFLKVVDRSSLEGMLREQQLGMSGMIDPESAAKAGKLIGLKYVLMTAISDLVYEDAGPRKDSIVAYEAVNETIPATTPGGIAQTLTRFKKVKYLDDSQKRRLYYRVFYQLVSTQTAQVVASEVISEELKDEVHFCSYAGNVKNLYPELPVNNAMPPRPTEFREQFNQVPRDVMPKEEMTLQVCKTISKKMMEDISIYLDQ